ncbi:hypothetical protein EUX98_g6022 [Antrodiella citrinella]|uniref:F-box domain-containing protein n=1 Tax=Antrodiella citrinella TaxID=2447956 RepID=A0A4S4MQ59_9APHY|nr:hypothetical protein EUX98_g6022 [Antrodiella citrinella]
MAPAFLSVHFLDAFIIPASARIEIAIRVPEMNLPPEVKNTLCAILTPEDRRTQIQPVDKLSVSSESLVFNRGCQPTLPTTPRLLLCAGMFGSATVVDATQCTLLRELCSKLPLKDVTTLELNDVYYLDRSRQDWLALFGILGNTETLDIHGCDLLTQERIIHLLSACFESAFHNPARAIVMPRLRRIILHDVEFRRLYGPENVASSQYHYRFIEGLRTVITLRRDLCSPVQEIVIRTCRNMN